MKVHFSVHLQWTTTLEVFLIVYYMYIHNNRSHTFLLVEYEYNVKYTYV